MLQDRTFYDAQLESAHLQVLVHPLTQNYLRGDNFRLDGLNAEGLVVELPFGVLNSRDFAHLFGIYEGSRVHRQREEPSVLAPEGMYFTVVNGKLLKHKNKIGLIATDGERQGLFLFVDHFFLQGKAAPPLLGTISTLLCAIQAHLCGLEFIELIAAGGVGFNPKHFGYKFWPKVGFDAPLLPDEMAVVGGAETVLDVVDADPHWWEANGSQRLMRFDLAAGSRSWTKLLSYVVEKSVIS